MQSSDGAHTLGQQLDINLSEAQPDFNLSLSSHYSFQTNREDALVS